MTSKKHNQLVALWVKILSYLSLSRLLGHW